MIFGFSDTKIKFSQVCVLIIFRLSTLEGNFFASSNPGADKIDPFRSNTLPWYLQIIFLELLLSKHKIFPLCVHTLLRQYILLFIFVNNKGSLIEACKKVNGYTVFLN